MTNYLKSGVFFLICTFTLFACTSKSEKGEWTESDMENCIKETIDEFNSNSDASVTEAMEILKVNIEEAADCMCKKAEGKYESYEAADKAGDEMSDSEAAELFSECLNLGDMQSADGGWTEEAQELFLAGCNQEPGYEDFCECGLEKIMEIYTFSELEDISEENMGSLFEECLYLVE